FDVGALGGVSRDDGDHYWLSSPAALVVELFQKAADGGGLARVDEALVLPLLAPLLQPACGYPGDVLARDARQPIRRICSGSLELPVVEALADQLADHRCHPVLDRERFAA